MVEKNIKLGPNHSLPQPWLMQAVAPLENSHDHDHQEHGALG